jgi:hypothetical protein
MNMMVTFLTGLVLGVLALPVPAPTAGDSDDAEGVLKAAGLKQSGTSYVLPEEADVIKLEDSIAKLQDRLDGLGRQYQNLQAEYNREKQAAASDRSRAGSSRNRGRYEADARAHVARANQHAQQAARVKQETAQPERDLQKQQADYREQAGKLKKQYAELAAKPEIFDALRAVNRTARPKFALGPASAYRQNVIKLMTDTLARIGFTPDGPRFEWTDQSRLRTDLDKTLLLGREVAMFERLLAPTAIGSGAAPAATGAETKITPEQLAAKRADLRARVKDLRGRIPQIQAAREAAIADGEAQGCIDELNRLKVSKKPLELGTHGGLKVAIEGFQKLDQGLDEK